MQLSTQQKKYLRGLAHNLRPIVTVGDNGLSPGLVKELISSLDHHELIKVKIHSGSRKQREEIVEQLLVTCDALLVSRIGNVASIYKASINKTKIALP